MHLNTPPTHQPKVYTRGVNLPLLDQFSHQNYRRIYAKFLPSCLQLLQSQARPVSINKIPSQLENISISLAGLNTAIPVYVRDSI